jgi:acetylornithine aminotransferase
VSCAAALAVLDTIERDHLLAHVRTTGAQWQTALEQVEGPLLEGVRGRGFWLALQVHAGSAPAIQRAAEDAGFLDNAAAPDAVRLAPALILSADEAARFTAALPSILETAAATVSVGAESGGGRP